MKVNWSKVDHAYWKYVRICNAPMSYSRTLIENNIPILQKAILQKYSDIIQCIYSKYLRIKHEELSVTKIHPSNYVQSLQNLIVSDIGHLKMTKEAFCRYFKKMTKLTFTQFVNHYRIDIAKKLLLQGNTISEVCFQCGFESLSYFNRVFKKVTGTSPTGFRNEYLSSLWLL